MPEFGGALGGVGGPGGFGGGLRVPCGLGGMEVPGFGDTGWVLGCFRGTRGVGRDGWVWGYQVGLGVPGVWGYQGVWEGWRPLHKAGTGGTRQTWGGMDTPHGWDWGARWVGGAG